VLHVNLYQLAEHDLVAFGDVSLALEDQSLFLRLNGLASASEDLGLHALLALPDRSDAVASGPEEFNGGTNL